MNRTPEAIAQMNELQYIGYQAADELKKFEHCLTQHDLTLEVNGIKNQLPTSPQAAHGLLVAVANQDKYPEITIEKLSDLEMNLHQTMLEYHNRSAEDVTHMCPPVTIIVNGQVHDLELDANVWHHLMLMTKELMKDYK